MEQAAIVREYEALRQARSEVVGRLVKSLRPEEVMAAAKTLGLARGSIINLRDDRDIGILQEFAIHHRLVGGPSAVERMLAADPPPGRAVEMRVLRSMARSTLELSRITEVIPGLGALLQMRGEDEPILLVDQALAAAAYVGAVLLTRIHSPAEGWWMTSGLVVGLNAEFAEKLEAMMKEHQRQFGTMPSRAEHDVIMLRAAIATIADEQSASEELVPPDDDRATAPITCNSPRIGRNDPCPCGSGKKYKKCCGK